MTETDDGRNEKDTPASEEKGKPPAPGQKGKNGDSSPTPEEKAGTRKTPQRP